MYFDIMDILVGWAENLLVFLSNLQLKAAQSELNNLKALRIRIKNHQAQVQDDLNDVDNDIEVLQYWIDQEYKEL